MNQGTQSPFSGTTQRDRVRREVGGSFRMGNTCIPVADSCLENPMNSMKRQNDRILREELLRSVGA